MGRDIHRQVLAFFERKMKEHDIVVRCMDVSDKGDYIFRIERRRGLPPVTVHLSDVYFYTELDYLSRPSEIGSGDFILIARPEAGYSSAALAEAQRGRIGMGQIGKLMGALHCEEIWKYRTKEEEQLERDARKNWDFWRR
jgi:hypothetical protein